ncbi:MAG: TonB-dependent receptor plug domain-containing protein [Cytophagales bacterium]|nr:TonB-dependent receptor plug domain-containing protein [Cytophagales bacterium]
MPISLIAQNDTTNQSTELDVYRMSLDSLLKVEINSPSLIKLKTNLSSLPVVVISQKEIELSGARNLDELLEIYVPGFILRYKGAQGHAIGVRGIISDRNNKVLLLVNGKTMNGRALTGALSERFLTMLNDIERIEVIQSPQSSLYGPGAISSVINIYTKNAQTKGAKNEVQLNQGLVDYFTNVQLRHSNNISNDLSYSIYYGGDYATGVTPENSPTKFTFNGIDGNGDTIIAGVPTTHFTNNLNASYHNQPRHKAHTQVDYKKWSTWIRYTNGGLYFSPMQPDIISRDDSQVDTSSLKYTHLTAFTNYKNDWKKWGIDARLSYDQFSNRIQNRTETDRKAKMNREDELYSRVIVKYTSDNFSVGVGPAISYETFGLPAYGASEHEWLLNPRVNGYSYDANQSDSLNAYSEKWSTVMLSGIGEVQYNLKENINLLGGVRVDKHTYTGLMVSPRASIVWKPQQDKLHLFRFQYSRSNRRQDDADLRYEYLSTKEEDGQVEVIDFYELSGDIGLSKTLMIRPSIYYSHYDVVAWGGKITKYIGDLSYYGGELSMIYKGKKGYGKISHNFIKIIDFSKVTSPKNNVSVAAYGYGNSFHSFPDNITKLFYQYEINDKMSLSTSLQVTWYLNGAEDNAKYNNDTINNPNPNDIAWDLSKETTTSFQPSAYLHLGYIYNITPKIKSSLFAYNLLGLIDENLNKRVEFQKTSHYRIQPVSFVLRVDYDF